MSGRWQVKSKTIYSLIYVAYNLHLVTCNLLNPAGRPEIVATEYKPQLEQQASGYG